MAVEKGDKMENCRSNNDDGGALLCPDSKWDDGYGLEGGSLGVGVGAGEEEYFV